MSDEAKLKARAERTKAAWQPRASRQLSDEDARQIGSNCTGFVRTLLDWVRAEQAQKVTEAKSGPPPTEVKS